MHPATASKTRHALGLVALGIVSLCPLGIVGAQANLELEELRIALAASQAQVQKLGAEVTALEEKNENLAEALAASNAEGEHFRGAYQKLRERIEGMGIAAIDPDPSSLQAQYLRALSDYRLTREENDLLVDALGDLSAAITAFMKTAISSGLEERVSLEVALRHADDIASGSARPTAEEPAVSLHDARVVSMKEDLGLVVLNVGRNSGVQVGMPFQITRKDRPIGEALVIDVRDHICGVVLQDLIASDDPVKLGDSAEVDPTHRHHQAL